MKGITDKRDITCADLPYLIARAAVVMLLFFICTILMTVQADAATVTFRDSDGGTLSDPDTTYVIEGSGSEVTSTKYFNVPSGSSSSSRPITVILDDVNVTQKDRSPDHSFIHVEGSNYVIIKLRNSNRITAWSHQETAGSNDGMSAVHVSNDATVKITSEQGDGSTEGSLTAYGGGGKYGGAGIGARYNKKMGTLIIAGGTIEAHGGCGGAGIGGGRNDTDGYENAVQITGGKISAYGGDEGAGIGSGRDGNAYSIKINGGDIYAEGGEYAAAIGAGNAVGAGSGGNLVDLSITGGKIRALGGIGAAGIGCSDEGELEGKLLISSEDSDMDIVTSGRAGGAGIGGGNASNLDKSDLIEISGKGSITAYGGKHAAGIGGGREGSSPEIRITGATNGQRGSRGEAPAGSRQLSIIAMAGGMRDGSTEYNFNNEAAAIGSGRASGGDITIKNAVLTTRADSQGADIGGGLYHINPSGEVKNITIDNCDITSQSRYKSAPGIGAGYGGSVRNITISDTKYRGGSIGGAPMDVPYTDVNDVDTITISNSDISAVWDEESPGPFPGGFTPSTGPQEHGAAGIGSGQYGSMDSIKITGSNIVAHGYGSGSGIGAGGAGGNGFTFLDLTKWSVGDTGTIEISGSDIDAHSGKAHFDPHTPIMYWDGHVWIKIDNPKMFGGGAGIGGGSASDTGTVWIHDCGTIKAVGDGCGIGTGEGTGNVSKGGVDYIWLENIKKLHAEGGNNSAGIGTGGSDGGINQLDADSGALKQIFIKNCEELEAHGGDFAAGIGLGAGSPYFYNIDSTEKSKWPMEIIDSNVRAYGGAAGAGIGGGFEDYYLNNGGENPRLHIKGKCRIEAYGGPAKEYEDGAGMHGGGAGIGGGCCGAGSYIEIDLEEKEVYDQIAKGSFEDPRPSGYYVKAEGGGGGAGIGSGGKTWDETYPDRENADTDTVVIKHGAVFARGGASADNGSRAYDDFYLGAGAGIGGGSFGSRIRYLFISGGYIEAKAGAPHNNRDKADDIGAGGLTSQKTTAIDSDRKCGSIEISDGTVISDTIGTFTDERRISGGSVKAVVKNATEKADTGSDKVYRTKMRMPEGYESVKIDKLTTTKSYSASHIYSDKEGYVYLYLKEKGSDTSHDQTADADVNLDGKSHTWHYSGYTDTEHAGIIKMAGGRVPFIARSPRGDEVIRYGDDFELILQDSGVQDGSEWKGMTASGCASITDPAGTRYISHPPEELKVGMHADSLGEFTVRSVLEDFSADETRYWGSKAYYKGTVQKTLPDIGFAGDPSKVYDAQPAEDPVVTTNSSGAVTFEYFTDADCTEKTTADDGAAEEGGAPVNAGEYWVKATVAETGAFDTASAKKKFEIAKAATVTSAEFSQNGTSGAATAVISGLYERDYEVISGEKVYGYVKFTVTRKGVTGDPTIEALEPVYYDESGIVYRAQLTRSLVETGTYSMKAEFSPSVENYLHSKTGEIDGIKDVATRTITGSRLQKKEYGQDQFGLQLSTNAQTANDSWSYSVIHDSYADNYSGFDNAVQVDNSGTVTIDHAGRSVIKAVLTDKAGEVYAPATAYVTIEVEPAELNVASFAYDKAGGESDVITEVTYGNIDNVDGVAYGLSYSGFVKESDNPGNFTGGHGTLSAAPLSEQSSVSPEGEPYRIGIVRHGADITINGTTRKVFFSRDYDIIESKGPLAVVKAKLSIDVDDAEGVYGDKEPAYRWSVSAEQPDDGGLAAWDSEAAIFTEGNGPKITRRGSAALKPDYRDLDARTYEDGLGVKAGDSGVSPNYDPSFGTGDLTVKPADISDVERFSFGADKDSFTPLDIMYNGRVQKRDIEGFDYAFGEETPKKLTARTDYTEEYPDRQSMKDAGWVRVEISGKGNYTGTRYARYKIFRKPLLVRTQSAEKEYDGIPLTAPGEMRGLVPGETATLKVTGSQTKVGSSRNTYELRFGSAKKSNYAVVSICGLLTVTEDGDYYCSDGSGSEWIKGSGKTLKFTFKHTKRDEETFARFRNLEVDGKEVDEKYYTVRPGSAVISLSPDYLEKLRNEKHSLKAYFSDGESPEVSFTVTATKGGRGGPGTGDEETLLQWVLLMLAAAFGIAELGVLRMRKK